MRIRIGSTIANDYAGRDVFPFIKASAGVNPITKEQAEELLADATWQAEVPDDMAPTVQRAYRRLVDALRAVLR